MPKSTPSTSAGNPGSSWPNTPLENGDTTDSVSRAEHASSPSQQATQCAANDRFVGGILQSAVNSEGVGDTPISKYVNIPEWCREYLRAFHGLQPVYVEEEIVQRMVLCLDYFYNMHKKTFDTVIRSAIAKKQARGGVGLITEDFDTTVNIPSYDINVHHGVVYPRPRNGRATRIPIRHFADESQPVISRVTTEPSAPKESASRSGNPESLTNTTQSQDGPGGPSSTLMPEASTVTVAPPSVTDNHQKLAIDRALTTSTSVVPATASTSREKPTTSITTPYHATFGGPSSINTTEAKVPMRPPPVPIASSSRNRVHVQRYRGTGAVPNTCAPKPKPSKRQATTHRTESPFLGETSSGAFNIPAVMQRSGGKPPASYQPQQTIAPGLLVHAVSTASFDFTFTPSVPAFVSPYGSSSFSSNRPYSPAVTHYTPAAVTSPVKTPQLEKPQGTFNNVARHDTPPETEKTDSIAASEPVTQRGDEGCKPSDSSLLCSSEQPAGRVCETEKLNQETYEETMSGEGVPSDSTATASKPTENQGPATMNTGIPHAEDIRSAVSSVVPAKRKRRASENTEVSSSCALRGKGGVDVLSASPVKNQRVGQSGTSPVSARRSGRLSQKETVSWAVGTGRK